jgi:hypothetical protein
MEFPLKVSAVPGQYFPFKFMVVEAFGVFR